MGISGWLREISYVFGIVGNFTLFMILFIPRIQRKKANIILVSGFFCMFTVHQILSKGFHVSVTNASLFAMSIPSFILCFLLSEYRDGRFIFTFCLADISYVIVRIISTGVLSLSGNPLMQSVLEFSVKIVLLGAVICVAWRLRFDYEKVLSTMKRGWGLLAWESVFNYVFFYMLISYTAKINNRGASLLVLLFYSSIVLITYLVIFKLIMQISKTQAEEAKNLLLETQLKLQESELMVKQLYREMAYMDQLTGIGNRAAFEQRMEECGKDHRDVVLFLFDINGLKQVNDTYGHNEGDFLIKNVAEVINETFVDHGNTYRIGGDELVTLVENMSDFHAEAVPSMVNRKLSGSGETVFSGKPYRPSVSTGFTVVREADMEKLKHALIHADQMMYEEKKANKTRRNMYSEKIF